MFYRRLMMDGRADKWWVWAELRCETWRHGLKTIATSCHQPPPACSDPDTARRVARVSGHQHPAPGRAREIEFFIIDKWLECPGRALSAHCLGQKYLHWNEKCFYCIPIYFCERFVIPLLLMLYSLLILPIWVPALTGPVRPAVLWCGV